MKKVLILAYDFPPYVSVGGLRPKSWYDYFHEFGIEPIVITRQWSNKHKNELDYIEASDSDTTIIEKSEIGTIIRAPYKPNFSNRLMLKYGSDKFRLIRKINSGLLEFGQFIFPIGPKMEVYKAAQIYLSEHKVDCIIATADPFVLFHYANKLSKKHQTPWIADYRDAWTTMYENQNQPIQKIFFSFFQKRICKEATLITTVSKFVKKKIQTVVDHPSFHIFPNGFDPVAMKNVEHIDQQSKTLKIAMIGSIMPWNPIDRFLQTFSDFVDENSASKIELIFYGLNKKKVLKEKIADEYSKLVSIVTFSPKLPNSVLMEKLAECNVMLLFNYYSFMGTKIFDYIGIQRKIILCFTEDAEGDKMKENFFPIKELDNVSNQLQAELINETNSGIAVKDAEHLKQVFSDLVTEFNSTGKIACNSVEVDKYSRKIQVQKLAELILSIC